MGQIEEHFYSNPLIKQPGSLILYILLVAFAGSSIPFGYPFRARLTLITLPIYEQPVNSFYSSWLGEGSTSVCVFVFKP